MKKLVYCLLAILPAYVMIQSCKKLDGITTTNGQLTASKSEVKINEPDTVLAISAKATDAISWAINPSGSNTISTKDNAAAFTFSKAGTYSVTATVNGATTTALTIKVNDVVYTPPAGPTTVSLDGDQINITPALYKSSKGDSTYIYVTATTTKAYCVSSRLNFTYGVDASNSYSLNFANITQNGTCSGPIALRNVINLKQSGALLANGTYPFSVVLNGTTYTGSVAVSATTVVFNWNYTSGVVLTTKTITR